ncbi:11080_t:CDS:1, partial [Cetraspora pellucida]
KRKTKNDEKSFALHCDKASDYIVTYYFRLVAKRAEKLTSDSDDQDESFDLDQKKRK